jgi:hypothetical protein
MVRGNVLLCVIPSTSGNQNVAAQVQKPSLLEVVNNILLIAVEVKKASPNTPQFEVSTFCRWEGNAAFFVGHIESRMFISKRPQSTRVREKQPPPKPETLCISSPWGHDLYQSPLR